MLNLRIIGYGAKAILALAILLVIFLLIGGQ